MDPTAKLKLNLLINQYEAEAKYLGAENLAKKVECTQTVIKNDKKEYIYKGTILTNSRKREYLWSEQSCIIYFYIHPFMGYQNLNVTASVFAVNQTTLKGWLATKDMILSWLPRIVENINGLSVKQAIPSKHAHKFSAPSSYYAVKYLPLYLCPTKYRKIQRMQHTSHLSPASD